MIEQANQVREFMRAFSQELPGRPVIPDGRTAQLRHDLIAEESLELYQSDDNTEALDAICDLLYVVLGAGAAYGFRPGQIAKGFAEVHRSNMSKLWTKDEVDAYINLAAEYKAEHVGGGKYIVKNAEGKVIKSPSYSPADLKGIVEE